jgi:hypothetical protein
MIRCPQCSHECLDGTLFCDDCGCDLAGVEPQSAAAAAISPSIAPAPMNAMPPSSIPDGNLFSASHRGPSRTSQFMPPPIPDENLSTAPVPAGGGSHLVVMRGVKPNEQFKLWDGDNLIGRMDDKHVDIDLEAQESPDRQWASRQHAVVRKNGDEFTIEDIGSANGTFVNRGSRLQVGQSVTLQDGDTLQIGTVHLKFVKE